MSKQKNGTKTVSEVKEILESLDQGADFFSHYAEEIAAGPLFVGLNFWGDVVYVRQKDQQSNWENFVNGVKVVFDYEGIDHGLLFTIKDAAELQDKTKGAKMVEILSFSNHGVWVEYFKATCSGELIALGELIEISDLETDHPMLKLLPDELGPLDDDEDGAKRWEIRNRKREMAQVFRSGEWLEEPLYLV